LARALSVAATLPHRLLPNMPNLKPRLLAAFGTGDPELIGRVGEAYAQTLTQFAEADEKSGAFKEFMQALSAQVALCMESAIGESTTVIAELRDKGTVLERHVGDLKQKVTQSEYDTLTKVFTRAGFMTRAARFVAMARENRAVSALGFVDIDDFKKMNDQHGHEAGDRALTTVATTLVAALRGDGIVGRMGGDEFCFVLFAKDHTSLAKAFEHIENAFCHLDVDVADAKQARLSSSVGIVALEDQGPPPDLEKMIKNADELMYGAKRAGKGRCFTRTSRAA
jgi:diguanylate cyclase (GGDEF)-like protein